MMIIVAMVALGPVALFARLTTTNEFQRYVERGGDIRRGRFESLLVMYYDQNQSWEGVQPLVEQISQISGDRIILADSEKRVLADSDRKLVGQAAGQDWAPPAGFVVFLGTPVGVVYINPLGRPSSGAGEEVFLGSVNRSLLLAVIATGLAAVLLTLALSRRILRPIEALTAAARQMEKGDLNQRVEVKSGDEIGQLAHAFNAMADGLARLEQLRFNMVTDVAHELRTPLSNIRGYLEAMRDGVTKPSPVLIDSLYEEAMLLNRLVDDLQELALAEAGQLKLVRQPVALVEIVEKVVNVLQPQLADKGLTVETDLPADLPRVDADPDRVGQILRNLLTNAVNYTPPGGKITVAAKSAGADTSATLSTWVEVSVRDTGIGITPEHLPYIFERFYRADKSRARATGGAGLGLAIVKQLVEAHGGRVWAESTPGSGAILGFTLPVSGQPEIRA
jgi:signal transduction histidine kinase